MTSFFPVALRSRREPGPIARTSQSWLRIDWLTALVLALFGTAAAWLRLPAEARGTLWAEDAQVFSARALGQSPTPWGVLSSYDGYVHAVPQMVANAIWGVVPIADIAVAFTLASCAIAGAVAGGVYVLSRTWITTSLARILLAAVTVLTPGQAYETLGNIANIHWYLLWLTPFLFLFRPRRWWSAGIAGVVAALILSTEVQAVLFVPLLLVHFRDRLRWPIVGGVIAGGAVQAFGLLGGGRATGSGLPSVGSVLDGYALQVPLLAVTGSAEAASATVAATGWTIAWAALLPFVACVVAIILKDQRSTPAFAVAYFALASLIIWSAGYALNRSSAFDFSVADPQVLQAGVPLLRYAIVPLMLLLAGVAILVDLQMRSSSVMAGALTSVLLIAVLIGGAATNIDSPRSQGPTWQQGLADASRACDGDQDHVVEIRTAPLYGQWFVPLPCDRLLPEDLPR